MKKFLLIAALAAVTPACFAASPWDGTWKLNESKSNLVGATVVITQSGNMYTFKVGTSTERFACDGKEYPSEDNGSTICTQNGNTYTLLIKVNGKPYITETDVISADGKTMDNTDVGTRPDGTPFKEVTVNVREGEGHGLVGTWKETKAKGTAPPVLVLKVNGDVLHWEVPSAKRVSDGKLDGTPVHITGPLLTAGDMISNKLEGGRIVLSRMVDGKESSKGTMSLSADGKTLTEVLWRVGEENEKHTYVYEKQ